LLGFLKNLFKKKQPEKIYTRPLRINDRLSRNLEKNLETFKNIFKDCDDVIFKRFCFGPDGKSKGLLIFIDGLVEKERIHYGILEPLIYEINLKTFNNKKEFLGIDYIVDQGITAPEVKRTKEMRELVEAALSGETVLIIEGFNEGVIVGTRGWKSRNVEEPTSESAVRGPREGFVENLKTNTTLIRRRLRDNELKVKMYKVGTRTNTEVAVLYVEDLANPEVVKEVDNRIRKINKDAIQESGEIEQLIEDDWLSPFPQVRYTERPDVAVSSLMEGKIAIIVDTSPFVILVPMSFIGLLQTSEDYFERWYIASFIRLLRFTGIFISLMMPGLYVALIAFHPGMIPTPLALSIAATREGVPFTALVEALIMSFSIELLREAGLRLPAPIGQTVGMVGGIIVGEAAVRAGIVSPIMVIIVAFTAISSFATPNYSLAAGIRVLTFVVLGAAAFLGLYGIALVFMALVVHLVTLKSFGSHYLSPLVSARLIELLDTFIRAPLFMLKYRPGVSRPQEYKRQRDKRRDNPPREESED